MRTYAAEDATTIARRIREITAERMAAVAGCICPRDTLGNVSHAGNCALREPPPEAMASLSPPQNVPSGWMLVSDPNDPTGKWLVPASAPLQQGAPR